MLDRRDCGSTWRHADWIIATVQQQDGHFRSVPLAAGSIEGRPLACSAVTLVVLIGSATWAEQYAVPPASASGDGCRVKSSAACSCLDEAGVTAAGCRQALYYKQAAGLAGGQACSGAGQQQRGRSKSSTKPQYITTRKACNSATSLPRLPWSQALPVPLVACAELASSCTRGCWLLLLLRACRFPS